MCLFACLFPLKRSVAKSSWVLLEKSVSAIPFSLSCVVSENLSYCDRSYCQTSYCVWKVSGLPWGAAWSTAGCGILQSACSVGSLCLLRWLEQGQGAHIRAALSALPSADPERRHPPHPVVYWSCVSPYVDSWSPSVNKGCGAVCLAALMWGSQCRITLDWYWTKWMWVPLRPETTSSY